VAGGCRFGGGSAMRAAAADKVVNII